MSPNRDSQEPFAEAESDWDLQKLYQDLAIAKQKVAPHKQTELTDVEQQHLRGLLCGYSPAEIAEQLFKSPESVKVDLSNTIYRYVKALTGRNSLGNWRTVVDWLEAEGYRVQTAHSEDQKLLEWGTAPDVSSFFGREAELTTLKQWLVTDRCRLIAILGIWGIGKTTLAARLADQVKSEFDCLIWRSLLYPVPLESVLVNWLQSLSQCTEMPVPDQVESQISCLIETLQARRCLLILDGLETMLQSGDLAGHYQTGYRKYGELLKCVGQARHQSCILLTSREKPPEVAIAEGDALPVRSLGLNGLSNEAAQELLKIKRLSGEEQWQKLTTFYRGNPLVLNIVATSIRDLFDGDVTTFLQESRTRITRDLSSFLNQLFDRLSPIEWQIMRQLAQTPAPMKLTQLEKGLHPASPYDVFGALESLLKRSFIERSANQGFTLQPVIAEYLRQRDSNVN